MNTSDSAVIARGRIGLIELPALAETLTQCGLQVVTGQNFRAAATAIIAESRTAGAFPIVVADVPEPGLRAWVGNIQNKTPVKVAVVRDGDTQVIQSESVAEIQLPTTVNAVLASVGIDPIPGPEGSLSYPVGEASFPAGIELPDIDFLDEEPAAGFSASPVPAARPAIPAAFAAPATPEVADEDPFAADMPAITQAAPLDDWDAPVEASAPAADEWDTPRATSVASQPPISPTPHPDTAAAPAQDEWDTPVEAPAQPGSRRAARAAQQEQDWTAPVSAPVAAPLPVQAPAPTPIPEPAPVQMAAPEMVEEWDGPQYQAPAQILAPPAEDFGDWDTPELPVIPVHVAQPMPPAENYFTEGAPQPQQQFVQAPAGTPAWYGVQTPPTVTPDSAGIFDDYEASKLAGTGRTTAGLGAFVINYSGKGGVGKSTTSIQLACAAAEAGLRVILIDGNSGQGDLRTYLRLNRTNLPTMYDAAIGNIKDAILTPATINANREDSLGEIKFAFIGAPPDDINDATVVTDALYRDVIHFARRNADLVIMDTQIVESTDRTGVVGNILLPALVHDAWGIGVADMSTVGVNNLNNRLRKFINEGVPTDRLMVIINQVHPEQLETANKAVHYFRNLGTFLGAVELDINVKHAMNAGRINMDNEQLRAVMSKALLRITGNEAFRQAAEYKPEPVKKQGVFARLLGKKAAA